MNTTTIIESKNIDKNTHLSNYKVGNSVFVVKSHFAGKDRLEDLIFKIIAKKSAVHNAEIPFRA